jgi:hypothetical protein
MPLKPHPTELDKMVYASRHYDIPQLQGVTTPQRPWVGLTDAEAQWLYDNCRTPSNLIDMVETMLKDKNT